MAMFMMCCTPELDEVTLLHADHSRAVLEELARVGLVALKLPQTLYVHN